MWLLFNYITFVISLLTLMSWMDLKPQGHRVRGSAILHGLGQLKGEEQDQVEQLLQPLAITCPNPLPQAEI